MNLVLLITQERATELEEFCADLSRWQKVQPGGVVAIIFDSQIPAPVIGRIYGHIRHLFPINRSLPVQINTGLPVDAQCATLLALFIMQLYSGFPGAWMVVDSKCFGAVREPMTRAEHLHRAGGRVFSGRGEIIGGAVVPLGPVVMSVVGRILSSLNFASGESWRIRGKWLFQHNGFYQYPMEQYPFSLSKPVEAEGVEPPINLSAIPVPNPTHVAAAPNIPVMPALDKDAKPVEVSLGTAHKPGSVGSIDPTPQQQTVMVKGKPNELGVIVEPESVADIVADLAQPGISSNHPQHVQRVEPVGAVALETGIQTPRTPIPLPFVPAETEQAVAQPDASTQGDLEALSRDQLLRLAQERGLKPHHNLGTDKLKSLLTAEV